LWSVSRLRCILRTGFEKESRSPRRLEERLADGEVDERGIIPTRASARVGRLATLMANARLPSAEAKIGREKQEYSQILPYQIESWSASSFGPKRDCGPDDR
jgi:hypothetical protein